VAAATEGYLLGVPSIAVSLVSKGAGNYVTAARVVAEIVKRHQDQPFTSPVLLNVNVPDVAYEQILGREVTRLGRRHKAEPVVKSANPRGETVYWVGAAGAAQDAGAGTDFGAVARGMVSVTPLQIDLTHYGQMEVIKGWL
jgi:5'-nucleotidase